MAGVPTSIRLRRKSRVLELAWEDGTEVAIPCELLRVYSPSAEVRGHGEGQRILQTGKKHVNIDAVEPVGNYAVRLVFDDGHDTGIYTWAFLHDLGTRADEHWASYLKELEQANGSRLPPIALGEWRPPR
ncbi:MAG TPA: DUF971 domain-containing protein [Pseudomonadales bacterium]|nr:DUF971 domain-containing protein [Pseudomonadales bacterium]